MENITRKIIVIMAGLALSVGASTTVYATATRIVGAGNYAMSTQVSKTCQTAGARDKIDAQVVVALCAKNNNAALIKIATKAVHEYEVAPIDIQPNITKANALGAIAQTAVGPIKDTSINDMLQASVNNQNAKIAARVVYLQIGGISAVNGTITLTYNNPLSSTPAISAFTVTQKIGTGTAITVEPTAVNIDATKKIVVLTLPKVSTSSTDQNVVDIVSYDTAVPVTASGFKVVAQP